MGNSCNSNAISTNFIWFVNRIRFVKFVQFVFSKKNTEHCNRASWCICVINVFALNFEHSTLQGAIPYVIIRGYSLCSHAPVIERIHLRRLLCKGYSMGVQRTHEPYVPTFRMGNSTSRLLDHSTTCRRHSSLPPHTSSCLRHGDRA